MFGQSKVIYWVRADFFHHNHIHRRKIDGLRAAGIDAELVTFVSPEEVRKYREEYEGARKRYDIRVIPLPSRTNDTRRSRWIVRSYFLGQIARHGRVLVHCLLCDARPLFRLIRTPLLRGRLRMLMEYEGDLPAEMLYMATSSRAGGPLEEPDALLEGNYRMLLTMQRNEIDHAKSLLVVSKEHLDLLVSRMGRSLKGHIFPTLFDPTNCRFSPEGRHRVRERLGYTDEVVLLHLGGVVNPWHRFTDVCQFIRRLHAGRPGVRLLGVIRKVDLEAARETVRENGIEGITTLLHVPADEVGGYLSAADLGLFLRHEHTMTRIVTSAKLGEYLASGLPVVSTGAHAVFNDFMKEKKIATLIPDSLVLSADFDGELERLVALGRDDLWRQSISMAAIEEFCVRNDPMPGYIALCRELLGRDPG